MVETSNIALLKALEPVFRDYVSETCPEFLEKEKDRLAYLLTVQCMKQAEAIPKAQDAIPRGLANNACKEPTI